LIADTTQEWQGIPETATDRRALTPLHPKDILFFQGTGEHIFPCWWRSRWFGYLRALIAPARQNQYCFLRSSGTNAQE
jgi:hypothetical protein